VLHCFNWKSNRNGSLGRSGVSKTLSGALWALVSALGHSGNVCGRSLGALGVAGALLGALGALLGPLWKLLGRSWALLGCSWDSLGRFLLRLAAQKTCLGRRGHAGNRLRTHGLVRKRFWSALGRSWSALGPSLEALGALLGALGMLLGLSWPFFVAFGRSERRVLAAEDTPEIVTQHGFINCVERRVRNN
jgi:hypothetical protein